MRQRSGVGIIQRKVALSAKWPNWDSWSRCCWWRLDVKVGKGGNDVKYDMHTPNMMISKRYCSLPETNSKLAPENGCLEYSFSFGIRPIVRGYG